MKKIIIALLAVFVAIAMTACSTSEPKAGSTTTNLQGTWKSESSNGAFMKAVVKKNTIRITLEDDDSSSLYWLGTFTSSAKDGQTIVSKADREALDGTFLGSTDETKDLTYSDGTLRFDMSMMGTTKHVVLKR